jgi:hypothetical protein
MKKNPPKNTAIGRFVLKSFFGAALGAALGTLAACGGSESGSGTSDRLAPASRARALAFKPVSGSDLAPGHLKHFGFYLVNTGVPDPNDRVKKTNYTDEVSAFTNLNQYAVFYPTQPIAADLKSMVSACTKPFISVELLFWYRADSNAPSGNRYALHGDWRERWALFKSTNSASLSAANIGAFYIADEPVWNGIPFAELDAVTQLIKGDYPDISTFYVEAQPVLDSMQVPTSMDWIGFDRYAMFNPAVNSSYLADLAKLKSRRSNNQKIVIISETKWEPYYRQTFGLSPADMGATIQSYYDLAAGDTDVIGLIGYLWPGGFDSPGSLGARNLPGQIQEVMKDQGRKIKKNNPICGVDTEPPTTPEGLSATDVSATTLKLAWRASTDNVGVTGYEVFKNGAYLGANTSPGLQVSGLSCATSYRFSVNAFDGQQPPHNISPTSAEIVVTTSACSGQAR